MRRVSTFLLRCTIDELFCRFMMTEAVFECSVIPRGSDFWVLSVWWRRSLTLWFESPKKDANEQNQQHNDKIVMEQINHRSCVSPMLSGYPSMNFMPNIMETY